MGTTANKLGRTFLSGALAVTLALPVVGVQKAEAAAGFPDWDVQTNAWYVPYIEWAVENGVVSGYPDGTFAPDQNVTRGQFAITGVLQGNDVGDGTFVLDSKGNFTRAQTAKVVTVLI